MVKIAARYQHGISTYAQIKLRQTLSKAQRYVNFLRGVSNISDAF